MVGTTLIGYEGVHTVFVSVNIDTHYMLHTNMNCNILQIVRMMCMYYKILKLQNASVFQEKLAETLQNICVEDFDCCKM